ncbi:MAG: DinB family protein [Marinoscillum sp.]
MTYHLDQSIEILKRTPDTLNQMLRGLSDKWIYQNEGTGTWSPFDVVGHLIHGEKTDWIPRMMKILHDNNKEFVPFDRFAQYEISRGKSLNQLLDEFSLLRIGNIRELENQNISEDDLMKTGRHPNFGEVSLAQLLSCWTVHDLNHISQISRVMAKQYKEAVGPWVEFLKILH